MSKYISEDVLIEYKGQIVSGWVTRKFGPFLRVFILVKGGYYRLAWIPKWRVKSKYE